MPIDPRLNLLTFPQSWDGASLVVRFLCLPKGDPQAPLNPGLPSFASANLAFEAQLIGSLDRLPLAADASPSGLLALEEPPTQKAALFDELTRQFKIVPRIAAARPQPQFRKVMTESYRALVGNRQRSPLISDADAFDCALHQGAVDQVADPVPPSDNVSWGRVISFCLRQPKLASGLGLLGQATVTPPTPEFFASGGWVYIDLHASSDFAAAGIASRYAARIPKLTVPRAVFAAVLFPVLDGAGDFNADEVFLEAQKYDDGLAKLVHCSQDSDSGDAIRLAWEDEQIAEWLQRQVQLTPGAPGPDLKQDAPTGVVGYRVDVRNRGDLNWSSLLRVQSQGDLQLGPLSLGPFEGESLVEVTPAQLSTTPGGLFWFPSYFANWRGSSLALTDVDLTNLHARPDVQNPDGPQHLLNREKVFTPVGDKAVPLQYGQDYEFRVRMADLTRGGPEASVALPDPPRNSMAGITFHRRRAPGQIEILERPKPGSRQVRIGKPRLGYPEALFTGKATFADLEQDLDQLAADPTITREISVPDPDVLTVNIAVQVRALDGESSPYLPLYTTTRTFDANDMTIVLDFEDQATLIAIDEHQPDTGSLFLPTARDLRLIFTGIGRDQPGYFADEQTRQGAPVNLDLHASATAEPDFVTDPEVSAPLQSFFFQPLPPDNTVPSPTERLAAEIGLDHLSLTLSGQSGKRTVVACSANLRHTLSPEASAITFASASDLVQRWINVVRFDVQRDWSWDGLDGDGISITRVVHIVGFPDTSETLTTFRLPRAIGPKSTAGVVEDSRAPVRQVTELILFDAFDPKPQPPRKFPAEVTLDYVLQATFQGLPAVDPVTRSILLPITTPPSQTPRVVSAGIALSQYQVADDYSSTDARQRVLWLEFAELPFDPDDAYFVRVLAQAPDPMLLSPELVLPDSVETPLAIDPEWVRVITPGQPRDDSGLSAMQQLEGPQVPPAQCVVPLPPDLQATSNDLLGFFVYEVRLGHTSSRWSTAQGRFGPMLRVAGVQHPAPPLVCHAARNATGILVQAPYATPVFNGANLRPLVPQTDLWSLLYARVRQADGLSWRNVLLAQVQLFAPQAGNDPERAGVPILYGEGVFDGAIVADKLARLGLAADAPLTTLAAELFSSPSEANPLGDRLGHARILRISPLIPVPNAC